MAQANLSDARPHIGGKREGLTWGFARNELFFIVFLALSTSAIWTIAQSSVYRNGWVHAIFSTFDASALLWIGFFVALRFSWNATATECRSLDGLVAVGVILACLLPVGAAIWIVITVVSLYFILTSDNADPMHKGAWVFFAMSFPLFWGRRIFNLFTDYVLSMDAYLVSMVTQTQRTGNLVAMPGGEGFLQIAAACSSMSNVSLAVLCWTLFTQSNNVGWHPRNILWCLAACLSVIALNIGRIAVIGFFPHYYGFLHDGFGVTIFSWIAALVCIGVCYVGTRKAALVNA